MLVGPLGASELTDRFRQRATQAGATVQTVPDDSAAVAAVALVARQFDAPRVTATPEGARFAPAGALVGGSALEVADAEMGVSVGRLAVAETGSVLLGSNNTEARLVGMLARTHVVVVSARLLVPSLDDAAETVRALAGPGPEQLRYLGLVTGPSRTADIERVLTIGVQGPRALHVVLIEDS
ncbi:MAG TPA: lactate utilization protein [Candidatus Dormibacteraeota bacterium]|nr:lactate utilization protein [Candidatus Dormibacteraeota bacterium]